MNNPDLGTSESGFFSGTSGLINPPMIGFQGALDTTVPFNDFGNQQDILHSTNIRYRNESDCLNVTGNFVLKDPGINDTVYIKQCGTQNMYYILKELNRFTELYVDCNMKHGINKDSLTTDNFGVNATTEADVDTYIAIRAAIFFQTIMNAPITSFPPFGYRGKSLFRSVDDTSHITNQRICSECDGIPASDTCDFTEDPECP